jgi:hypothetical protein
LWGGMVVRILRAGEAGGSVLIAGAGLGAGETGGSALMTGAGVTAA